MSTRIRQLAVSIVGLLLLPLIFNVAAQDRLLDPALMMASGTASVTHTTLDIGNISNVFDGNTGTLARTANTSPFEITLDFGMPVPVARSRVWFVGGDNEWRLESADNMGDLNAASGSFRILSDWVREGEGAWREASFPAAACRLLRLKVKRIRDNYVHLNEWQIFAEERPLHVEKFLPETTGFRLDWNSFPGNWYEVQTSTDLAAWESVRFQKSTAFSTSGNVDFPLEARRFYRVREALPEERTTIVRKILVLNFDPVLESHGGVRLHEHLGWFAPRQSTAQYLADITEASGGYVQWQEVAWVDLDHWPEKTDGFRYTDATYLQSWENPSQFPWHSPDDCDYNKLLDLPLAALGGKTAHQMAASGEVDEVLFWGMPYAGFYESRMVGTGAYWCNSPGLSRASRLYVVMGLNYERDPGYALHSFGHRGESILTRVFGSWSSNATSSHLWDRFTRTVTQHGTAFSGVGNVHFPPNATDDYEYNRATPVPSEASIWSSYPALPTPGTIVDSVSSTAWGTADPQRNYLRWWMARFPKSPGRFSDPGNPANNGKLNNWWAYIADFNEYPESR